jgi:HD-like signal output (HDOD) protein
MAYIPLIARVNSLPPLPESVLKIETLYASGDPDIDDIVKIIEADPLLTADILVKVNAPFYGFSKTIIDILQAVTLFGATQIRSIVLSSSINRSFDIDLSPYNITTAEFSKISMIQSELVFQWYMGINIEMARKLTPIAFLMETGKILIAKDILQEKKVEDFIADTLKFKDISYVENIYTNMTTAQINAIIFEHLNLNETFYDSMKYLDKEKNIPKDMGSIEALIIALRIVRTAVNIQDQLNEYSLENARVLIEENSLDNEAFLRAVKRIKRKYFE